MTVAQFVERVFIPEHVAAKGLAGRTHLKGILKHVLSPQRVDLAFGVATRDTRAKISEVGGWPYLDAVLFEDVRPVHIQAIMTAALERGYSPQTVTHIRSVARLIFSHAQKARHFVGENPANQVVLPLILRRELHTLTADELAQLIRIMRHPEREMALLAIFTGMNVAEICGLQWKHVNMLDSPRAMDGEWISPWTIAIRKQSYRCTFADVKASRRREVSFSETLFSVLHDIKRRARPASPESFVLSSRRGTPINQDNIAARRLKEIGRRHNMPWLSWQVFHRTHVLLKSRATDVDVELESILRLKPGRALQQRSARNKKDLKEIA